MGCRNDYMVGSEVDGYKQELDLTTRLLCGLCQHFDKAGMALPDPELKTWWKNTKKLIESASKEKWPL